MIVSVKGLDSSIQKFDSLQVVTALNAGIKKSIFTLSATARKETPVGVSGFLRAAYRERFDNLHGELVNTKDYAKYVHDGRRPGKMPPLAPIALWVKRKGIGIPAFVIARSIARKGTKANPFLTRTIEKEETNIRAIIQ